MGPSLPSAHEPRYHARQHPGLGVYGVVARNRTRSRRRTSRPIPDLRHGWGPSRPSAQEPRRHPRQHPSLRVYGVVARNRARCPLRRAARNRATLHGQPPQPVTGARRARAAAGVRTGAWASAYVSVSTVEVPSGVERPAAGACSARQWHGAGLERWPHLPPGHTHRPTVQGVASRLAHRLAVRSAASDRGGPRGRAGMRFMFSLDVN
jgi:hypothetical protein